MERSFQNPEFEALLDELASRAVAREVSPEAASMARNATSRGLKVPLGPLSPQTRRRAESYFTAVVRRRAVRRNSSPRAAARFVVASIVQDLRLAGRSGSDIWRELEIGWAQRIPQDLLEEYRLKLCG
jgi:hypothetical protein